MSISEALMWVFFAHFVADWFFQNDIMANYKGKFWQIMFVHCAVYTAICSIALKYIGIFGNPLVYYALVIFITHYIIDKWKCNSGATKENFPTWHLYVDQGLHLLILFGIVYFSRH